MVTIHQRRRDLLHIYPTKQRPQPCFIELDTETGDLRADWDPEVGNTVPDRVWRGIMLRYEVPPLSAEAANALLARIAPIAERVVAGSKVAWDGHNHVGVQAFDASQADIAIQEMCAALTAEDGGMHWCMAEDWLYDERATIIARLRAGEERVALADELDGDGRDESSPALIGLVEYLDRLADEAGPVMGGVS